MLIQYFLEIQLNAQDGAQLTAKLTLTIMLTLMCDEFGAAGVHLRRRCHFIKTDDSLFGKTLVLVVFEHRNHLLS